MDTCEFCGELKDPALLHVCIGLPANKLVLVDPRTNELIIFDETLRVPIDRPVTPTALLHVIVSDGKTPVHTSMKLWHIERDDYGYDEWAAFIIRAETEQEARKIASKRSLPSELGFDTSSFMSLEHTTCVEVTVEGNPGAVLGSFMAG